jgi:HAD superfamily phosphatase (TIGR01681 family)
MYETEINQRVESLDTLPEQVRADFLDGRASIRRRTLLTWAEHCTECVFPSCYATCDLYDARPDGKCARFTEGMVRVDLAHEAHSYLLKVGFRRWAKLGTEGNAKLYSLRAASAIERCDRLVSGVFRALPVPSGIKMALVRKWYGLKKRWSRRPTTSDVRPDYFLLECYNPGSQSVSMTLTIRPTGAQSILPFQTQIEAPAGFTRAKVPVPGIARSVDLGQPFEIDITPNNAEPDGAIYFGLMDFVQDDRYEEPRSKLCKCVVWDLDNTLWKGTLVEDGPDAVELQSGIADVIRELDRRGILLSIVSKNNSDEALAVLRNFGLEEYFLYPQISWGPKGSAVAEIARLLNIGLETLIVLDDQPFEREQIKAACPTVTVLDAVEYLDLPSRPECQVPVTKDSANRRMMYQQQATRAAGQSAFDGDYFAFLMDCQPKLRLRQLGDDTLERVHELTQRTNQMNFSGNRYDRERLTETRLIDLMFSCRIQSKRVEHAFLTHVLTEFRSSAETDFHANYRKTDRNAPSGKVFDDMGFEQVSEADGVAALVFRHTQKIPDDGIIEVIVQQNQNA